MSRTSYAHQPPYPDISPSVAELKKGNSSHLEPALLFLERDPYENGTGYIKEKIWRYLRRVELTEKQRERLRAVALHYVKTRSSREFLPMCRFIGTIVTEKFLKQLVALKSSEDSRTRQRASMMQVYLRNFADCD